MRSHEDTGAAVGVGALHALVGNLRLVIVTSDLVVLEDTHGNVLVAVDGLLRLGEDLLLLLLALTSLDGNDDVDRRLLLHVSGLNGVIVAEDAASENELGSAKLSAELLDGRAAVSLKGDGATVQGLCKDLHCPYHSAEGVEKRNLECLVSLALKRRKPKVRQKKTHTIIYNLSVLNR